MQVFNTTSATPLTSSSIINANTSALLTLQDSYDLSDPAQQVGNSWHSCSKASHFNADFDGNGKTDLFWYNNRTGDLRAWLMNNSETPAVAYYGTVAINSGWALRGYGDFNGDGKTDLFWQKLSGETAALIMDGANAPISISYVTITPGSGWTLQGMGDFDSNSKTDLFWYNQSTGETAAWMMDAANAPTIINYGQVDPASGWVLQGMGEFDGDGKTDLFWFNKQTGETAAWMMNGINLPTYISYGQVTPISGWVLHGMGDLTGDGKTDLFWHNSQTGESAAWVMDGTSYPAQFAFNTFAPKNGWSFEGLADVTGNGKVDVIWYNKQTGQTETWMMTDTNIPTYIVKQQINSSYWDLQAIGDFNGNGTMDIFWRDYGMFSDQTQIWSVDRNSNYSLGSYGTESNSSGWQVIFMNQLSGLYLG